MKKLFFIFIGFTILFTQKTFAYVTSAESAELVPENQLRFTFEPQVNSSNFNFNTHFDTGVAEDSQVRLSAGVGSGNYHLDFFYKKIPFPDYDTQPAIGFKLGAIFARENKTDVVTPVLCPISSKNIMIDKNRLTPYIALPIGVSVYQGRSLTPVNFVAGFEFVPTSVENIQFGGEMGFNVRDSYSYVSGYVSFYFEPTEQIIENN